MTRNQPPWRVDRRIPVSPVARRRRRLRGRRTRSGAANPSAQKPAAQPKAKAGTKKKKDQKSEQEFRDGYRARLRAGAGRRLRRRLRGLQGARRGRHAGCRELSGYTARKLGDYELSKVLVRARARPDPKHVRTWQYYGMWQVEQGNMLKAADFLEKIEAICGTEPARNTRTSRAAWKARSRY